MSRSVSSWQGLLGRFATYPRAFQRPIIFISKPMTTLVTVVLWVVGLLVTWTLISLLCRLTIYLWRPEKTAIGDFVVEGQASPNYATKFHDRWLSFRSSGERIDLVQGLPTPGGTDFILAEVEQRSAADLERRLASWAKSWT